MKGKTYVELAQESGAEHFVRLLEHIWWSGVRKSCVYLFHGLDGTIEVMDDVVNETRIDT